MKQSGQIIENHMKIIGKHKKINERRGKYWTPYENNRKSDENYWKQVDES